MKVTVDQSSGFCWGVVRTIDVAEQEMERGTELSSLGDIIHNPMEIGRLREKGLRTIKGSDLEHAAGKTVLIRAHGEPPETYRKAAELGITIVDATCPVVTKVQERIRKFHLEGYQVVIFGKAHHAEVIGLVGQTDGEAVVVRSIEETVKLDLSRKTVLFSQTTMDKPTFYALRDHLRSKIADLVVGSMEEEAVEFHAKDTICGQVSGRDQRIREFARANDVVIFVAGKQSSNGKVLFAIAQSENERTYFIEKPGDLHREWFTNAETVGITGATSTPQWLMDGVKRALESSDVFREETVPSS